MGLECFDAKVGHHYYSQANDIKKNNSHRQPIRHKLAGQLDRQKKVRLFFRPLACGWPLGKVQYPHRSPIWATSSQALHYGPASLRAISGKLKAME